MSKSNYKEHLRDWVINYNPYTEYWQAAPRSNYYELFCGDRGHIVKSSNINTLIEVLNKKLYKKL